MAKHLSVRKRYRQSLVKNRLNRVVKTRIRSAIKQATSASGNEARQEALRNVASVVDKAAVKRVIHKNKAARIKSRLAKKTATPAAKP